MSNLLSDVRSSNWDDAAESGAVLVFLHGFGSNEHDLASLAEPLGLQLPWASLRAPLELGHGGAAWFQITTPGVPDAAPVEAATAAIWAWIDANADASTKIIPVGFSQGGLMASQLLRTRPERVLATTILGGFVLGGTQPADEIIAASYRIAIYTGMAISESSVVSATPPAAYSSSDSESSEPGGMVCALATRSPPVWPSQFSWKNSPASGGP